MTSPTLVWFRLDLRLGDNPALQAAVHRGGAVIPVFIWTPEEEMPWPPGAAPRWWLHESLAALEAGLREVRSRLVIRRGPTARALKRLLGETRGNAVFWNRRYEPAAVARDAEVERVLRTGGVEVKSFNAGLLHEPWVIRNRSGRPFQVFTPFWKRCLALPRPDDPLPPPRRLPMPRTWPVSLPLVKLGLKPKFDWAGGIKASWQPGEAGGYRRLKEFLPKGLREYGADRNRPDIAGTSRLSPHLHFGEISPRQVWQTVKCFAESNRIPAGVWTRWQFLAELGWREFAWHLLFHFPHSAERPLRSQFEGFPWRRHANWLKAWQRGQTGYPFVDAGMRELWETGWMHNRVRMVVASFLVKNLRISWTEGARWFWDTLVDADLGNNTLGWQWSAGCGADAAPYFRIFNPVTQGEKFDPQGTYVRRWVPEIGRLPDKWIHQPWRAPAETLVRAGIQLGETYPEPIVNHVIAHQAALQAYAEFQANKRPN